MGSQLSSVNGVLEASVEATKVALQESDDTFRKMETLAERQRSRAELEGLRAEEACSRRFISDCASAKQVRVDVC